MQRNGDSYLCQCREPYGGQNCTRSKLFYLGTTHKGSPQSGEEGFVQFGHFADKGGSSDADIRTFWCKKHRIFRNLWCICTDKGGGMLNQCGHFADKGEGQFFAILCGRPLKDVLLSLFLNDFFKFRKLLS